MYWFDALETVFPVLPFPQFSTAVKGTPSILPCNAVHRSGLLAPTSRCISAAMALWQWSGAAGGQVVCVQRKTRGARPASTADQLWPVLYTAHKGCGFQ